MHTIRVNVDSLRLDGEHSTRSGEALRDGHAADGVHDRADAASVLLEVARLNPEHRVMLA